MFEQRDVDYAIVAFKQAEFEALLTRFSTKADVHVPTPRRQYTFREVKTVRGDCVTVALVRTVTQGLAEAQTTATDVIEDLRPQCIIAAGIAGGVPSSDLYLGDVVLATHIHDFSLRAQVPSGVEWATSGYPIHHGLGVVVAALSTMADELGDWYSDEAVGCPRPVVPAEDMKRISGPPGWQSQIRDCVEFHQDRKRPVLVDGPIASSDELIKSPEALQMRKDIDRRVLAVEMEAAGLAKACRRGDQEIPLLVIRSISDMVGLGRRETYTTYACKVAASFAEAVVRTDIAKRIHSGGPVAQGDEIAQGPLGIGDLGALLVDPVPLSAVADALRVSRATLDGEIEELLKDGTVIRTGADEVRFTSTSHGGMKGDHALPLLYSILAFIERHATGQLGIQQCRNAFEIFSQLDIVQKRVMAARLFDVLDKPMKALGDKRFAMEVADACVQATIHEGARSKEEAECEARARICGLSWTHQRMGRLDLAAHEAELSIELARNLNSTKSLAFGKKCSGRLARLRAEKAESRRTQAELFAQSISELEEAIALFSDHEEFGAEHAEVGDCYSLLARTHLSMGHAEDASRYLHFALRLIPAGPSKDKFDLEILQGDMAARTGNATGAYEHYGRVLQASRGVGFEESEIVARAMVRRANLHARSGKHKEAAADYRGAADIWKKFQEVEAAAEAEWKAISLEQAFPRQIANLLEAEPSFVIRTMACRQYVEGAVAAGATSVAQRQRHDTQVMKACLRRARRDNAMNVEEQ